MSPDDALIVSVIDLLPVGVWVARAPGGEFVYSNRVFREIMGMEARDDVAIGAYAEPYGICGRDGRPYPEDRMPFVQALRARETITVDDIVIHRRDGGRVNIRAIARPILAADVVTHVVICFTDITKEVIADDARRASEHRLRRAQRFESLGRLTAGVAHDFNNVMASIRVLAALLGLQEDDPARRLDLHRIEGATDRAAQLTRALLRFGGRGEGPLPRLCFDDVVATVVDLCRRTFDPRIELVFEDVDGVVRVDGDPSQLEQVVMNLLVNARDAVADGGRIAVRLGIADAPPRVELEVEDTGPGVPVELREQIFEPYFTTKGLAGRDGAGLGLATARGVVQQHGGTLALEDVVPHGSRFRVVLPLSASTDDDAPRPDDDAPAPATGTGRVLLVDDDDEVRGGIRRLLERLGYQVIEARDGDAALDLYRAEGDAIDAVLLDAVMPRRDGRDTLRALRATSAIPVVITTGLATADDAAAWIADGASALLPKPFALRDLSELLAGVVRS
ncbi:MAG: response regulator [Kofleriaceae bacterium]|nr:response regulator [Myxococcales bacterium]MCB9563609.1 response regulator [Kofleriaceae bacterium]MCB9572897.1 response regulator [Kofleriaceae bacterium]